MLLDALEERWLLSGTQALELRSEGATSSPVSAVLADAYAQVEEHFSQPAAEFAAEPASLAWLIQKVAYGLAGEPAEPYPAVLQERRELDQPHETIESAQVLDDVEAVRVWGQIGPGEPTDVYRLPGHAAEYIIHLVRNSAGGPAGPRIWMRDALGRTVGEWTMPADATVLTIQVRTVDLQTGNEFIIGVTLPIADPAATDAALERLGTSLASEEPEGTASASPAADGLDLGTGSGGALHYSLVIAPRETTAAAPAPTSTSPPTAPLALSSGGLTFLSPVGVGLGQAGGMTSPVLVVGPAEPGFSIAAAATAGSATPLPSERFPALPTGLASGPLPVRLAGPFAGLLTDGDPVPELGRDDGTTLYLGSAALMAEDRALEPEAAAPLPIEALPELVALPAPGGLPLLAATQARRAPTGPEPDPEAPPPWSEAIALLTASPAPLDPAQADLPVDPPVPSPARPLRSWIVQIGMSLFAAASMTLVLPDLVPVRPTGRDRPRSHRRWLPWPRPSRSRRELPQA